MVGSFTLTKDKTISQYISGGSNLTLPTIFVKLN